jgi:hypothetical protein
MDFQPYECEFNFYGTVVLNTALAVQKSAAWPSDI